MSSNRSKHYSRSRSRDRQKHPKAIRTGDILYENDETTNATRKYYKSTDGTRKYRGNSKSSSSSYERHRLRHYKGKKSRSRSLSPNHYKNLPQAYQRGSPTRKEYPKVHKNGFEKREIVEEKYHYKPRKPRSASPVHHKTKLSYFVDEYREKDRIVNRYKSSPTRVTYSPNLQPKERIKTYLSRPRTPEDDRYETYRRKRSPPKKSAIMVREENFEKEYREFKRMREEAYYKSEHLPSRQRARSRTRSRSRERSLERYSYEPPKSMERIHNHNHLEETYEHPYEPQKTVVTPQIIPVPVPVPTHPIYNGAMFPTVYGAPVMAHLPRYHPPGMRPPPPRRMHPMPRMIRMHPTVRVPFIRPRLPPGIPPNHIRHYWP